VGHCGFFAAKASYFPRRELAQGCCGESGSCFVNFGQTFRKIVAAVTSRILYGAEIYFRKLAAADQRQAGVICLE